MSYTEITAGITTGIVSSVLFNPIDKIIFNSCLKNLSLCNSKIIYSNLYKGSFNTVITRIMTSGLYYSYIDYYDNITSNKIQVAGLTAILCSTTNPFQLVKFNSWYNDKSSLEVFKSIYNKKGMNGFTRGIFALILRDFIFNSIYLNYKEKNNHTKNLLVITTAIIITSPINLIKNKQYSTDENLKQIFKNFKVSQLGLGMSIFRNCLSFYASQLIYDNFKYYLNTMI